MGEAKEILNAAKEFGIGIIYVICGLLFGLIGFLVTPFTHFSPEHIGFGATIIQLKLVGKILDLLIGFVSWAVLLYGLNLLRKTNRMKTPKIYRPDNGLINSLKLNTKCDTLHKVTIQNYSEYANQLISNNPSSIFTVCTFEPYEIMEFLRYSYGKQEGKEKNIDDIKSHVNFLDLANNFFPHFKRFREYHKADVYGSHNVIRILVLRDDNPEKRNNEKWMLEKFRELNGTIPCFVITKNSLETRDVCFITDHVVYDDKFVIDYYDGSNTFILSCVDGTNDLERILCGIKNDYASSNGNYEALDKFIARKYA